jgi:hypothetical protein
LHTSLPFGIFHSLLDMRVSFSFWWTLLGSAVISAAFPTAANLAILARSGGLDIPDDLTLEEVFRHVHRQKEKRLLINPLTTPIKGMLLT